ncbi:Mitochondrial inner membrane signal peptidase,related [Neospora caninum Liverpool]|uniref:Mitochondrial inner membrane signal peptidase,related n=1 Tax=Neospora caninum (strain Liverpool) TaxID=572307 RepID=F0VJQ1_NEOCL|nr:Mitochondrial inner membrane signal peptidase,related [Neospora caninum Liverpool]CBZ53962.1 Mitochondrial inner membrane signal peptidase,related [Neospora caninum Liverpool]CEL67963.1 TPA: Mitochondrial inner membrane signal peptidase,related [Neospora caninum Liverpool]|eukprot:XP_003883994.1 Mitochondrial inner membrane signal peptidase,related [Neospora caninum Liverpool]
MWPQVSRYLRAFPRPTWLSRAKGKGGPPSRSELSRLMQDASSFFYIVSRWTVAVSLCSLCQAYIVWVEQTRGLSMEPTLPADGGLLVVEKISRRIYDSSLFTGHPKLKRGSIVLLVPPDGEGVVCKRIIGLPGDVLEVAREEQQFVGYEPVLVPPGHVWVQGDNGEASLDSRTYGCVSQGSILGTAMFSLWPLRFLPRTPPSMNGTRIIASIDNA